MLVDTQQNPIVNSLNMFKFEWIYILSLTVTFFFMLFEVIFNITNPSWKWKLRIGILENLLNLSGVKEISKARHRLIAMPVKIVKRLNHKLNIIFMNLICSNELGRRNKKGNDKCLAESKSIFLGIKNRWSKIGREMCVYGSWES